MDFKAGAEALAIQLGKAEDYDLIKSLEIDIIAARALSIETKYQRTGLIDQSLIQNVNCLEFRRIKDNRCMDGTGFVLRTTRKIPKPLSLGNNLGFISISNSFLNANNRKTLNLIKPEDVTDIQYRMFSSKEIYAVYENSYIYLIGKNISQFNKFTGVLRGLFADPREIKKLSIASKEDEFCKNCDECNDCNSDESEDTCFDTETFELEDNLYTDIQRLILSKRIQISQSNGSNITINDIS